MKLLATAWIGGDPRVGFHFDPLAKIPPTFAKANARHPFLIGKLFAAKPRYIKDVLANRL
ncbi:hypothetical protein SS37A_42760 (plasmid) [Methylocystis iwaonis]|uniref:Uncharacterized protein n=1 Tax=Methylocystis iwaonis TaxID=2885079 RepID=A0ABM8EFB6_9HYPH|nr:hypothetical protein SS37A_42760 [Methylocystis iwaonis]